LFSAEEARALELLEGFIIAVGVGIAVAIIVLGWLAGRLFPRIRYVAPFALAGLATACLRLAKDWYWSPFVVLWLLAAAAVALYWALRRPARVRPPEDGLHP